MFNTLHTCATIVSKNKINLLSLRNILDMLVKGLLFYLFLKLVHFPTIYTVKPAHTVTCIKRTRFSCPVIENFIWIKPHWSLIRPVFLCPNGVLLIQVWLHIVYNTSTNNLIITKHCILIVFFYFTMFNSISGIYHTNSRI